MLSVELLGWLVALQRILCMTLALYNFLRNSDSANHHNILPRSTCNWPAEYLSSRIFHLEIHNPFLQFSRKILELWITGFNISLAMIALFSFATSWPFLSSYISPEHVIVFFQLRRWWCLIHGCKLLFQLQQVNFFQSTVQHSPSLVLLLPCLILSTAFT